MSEEKKPAILIPSDRLSKEALEGLIEEFILREGTDYGTIEYSLDEKKARIMKQLKSGNVLVVFDPNEESTSLLRKEAIAGELFIQNT